nr:cation transporter dimerization domain-containing protein [uncultured Methanolobus sp.]
MIKNDGFEVEGVTDCHKIRSRGAQGNIFVDLHVQVDPEMPTHKSHTIAHIDQHRIKENFNGIEEVLVHVEPSENISL